MTRKFILIALAVLTFSLSANAHVIVSELESLSSTERAVLYLKLGFEHIIPMGFDHILFVLCLFLLQPKLQTVLWQSAAFTLAHSITLGLAMYGTIDPPAAIVEPLIAFSIVLVAVENLFIQRLRSYRIALIFIFGLVHGLGFASSLSTMGLPRESYFTSLLLFNLGVELGQTAVILLAFFLVGKWFGAKPFYRKRIVIPLSLSIAVLAAYWTIERVIA